MLGTPIELDEALLRETWFGNFDSTVPSPNNTNFSFGFDLNTGWRSGQTFTLWTGTAMPTGRFPWHHSDQTGRL